MSGNWITQTNAITNIAPYTIPPDTVCRLNWVAAHFDFSNGSWVAGYHTWGPCWTTPPVPILSLGISISASIVKNNLKLNFTLDGELQPPVTMSLTPSQYPTYTVMSDSTYTSGDITYNLELSGFINLAADNSSEPEPFNIITGPNIQFLLTYSVTGEDINISQTTAYFGSPLVPSS